MSSETPIPRRTFLKGTALTAAASVVPWTSSSVLAHEEDGLTLALQGYSLQELNLPALLQASKKIGVDHLELYDRQFSVHMSEHNRNKVRRQLERAEIHVPATYTGQFRPDEETNRAILSFGQAMGLDFFSCRPGRDTLKFLNRLAPAHDVGIAVHNTTPIPGEDKAFSRLADVRKALDQFEHVDACVDVGNFTRGGVDPIDALKALKGRVLEVHVKDVDEKGHETMPGKGIVDIPGVLDQLQKQSFGGLVTLEYTRHPNNIHRRIKDIRKNMKKLEKWRQG